jgi:hypothetical protein
MPGCRLFVPGRRRVIINGPKRKRGKKEKEKGRQFFH